MTMHDRHATSAPLQYSFPCAQPAQMLDRLLALKRLRTDADLSRLLGVPPPTISKIRTGKSFVSAAVLLRIHETFGVPVAELRALLAAR